MFLAILKMLHYILKEVIFGNAASIGVAASFSERTGLWVIILLSLILTV